MCISVQYMKPTERQKGKHSILWLPWVTFACIVLPCFRNVNRNFWWLCYESFLTFWSFSVLQSSEDIIVFNQLKWKHFGWKLMGIGSHGWCFYNGNENCRGKPIIQSICMWCPFWGKVKHEEWVSSFVGLVQVCSLQLIPLLLLLHFKVHLLYIPTCRFIKLLVLHCHPIFFF